MINYYKFYLFLSFSLISLFSFSQNSRLWGTYYGGTALDFGTDVAVDAAGNVYMVGRTQSDTILASAGGFQTTIAGPASDAFLVKFDALGNRLWATYYGGTGDDRGFSVAVDPSGNVYIAGTTDSPTNIASGGFQNTLGGGLNDVFLVKFDPSGNRLWGTYYGGIALDGGTAPYQGVSIATDNIGNVYLASNSASSAGIASGGFQNTYGGGGALGGDAFLVKFDAAGNRLWATYYGGTQDDFGNGVATDPSGNVYLTGYTPATAGIASGGFQNTYAGGTNDAFLVKFDTNGNRIWGTYFGGSMDDRGSCITTDGYGNVYIGGITNSTSNIAYNGFQNSIVGFSMDAFLVKFNASGNRLWATYYGGNDNEEAGGLATDAAGNVYFSGDSYSFFGNVAANGYQNTKIGTEDAFLAKFDSNGTRYCATYYGEGPGDTEDGRIATDASGNVYMTGWTPSTTGIASGGFQNTFGGGSIFTGGNWMYGDAYLVKFTTCNMPITVVVDSTNVNCNGLCTGAATATPSGGVPPYYYSWNTIPVQNSQTVTGLCAGTYTCIIKDTVSDSIIVTVTITEPLSLNVINTFTGTCIDDNTGSASANVSGGTVPYSYSWSNAQTTQTISGLTSQGYFVIVTDSNGCADTSFVNVLNFPSPVITVSGNDTVCEGNIASFTVSGALAYSWSTGSVDSSIAVSPLASTTYSVVGTDANGCADTATTMAIVETNAEASFTPNPTEGQIPLTVLFTNTSVNASSYTWAFGDTASSTQENPEHVYTEAGEYDVQLIANNEYDCPDTTVYSFVKAESISSLWIPGSFSPDNNGINDEFKVYTSGITEIKVSIFNRWGELIYDWDALTDFWDGKHKGTNAEEGVYVYVVKAKGVDGVVYNRVGHLTLVR